MCIRDRDESGAVLNAEQLRPYYGSPRVLGLAELMNAYGTVRCDPKILQKIRDCTEAGKIVDGHAPLLSDKDLNADVYKRQGVQVLFLLCHVGRDSLEIVEQREG